MKYSIERYIDMEHAPRDLEKMIHDVRNKIGGAVGTYRFYKNAIFEMDHETFCGITNRHVSMKDTKRTIKEDINYIFGVKVNIIGCTSPSWKTFSFARLIFDDTVPVFDEYNLVWNHNDSFRDCCSRYDLDILSPSETFKRISEDITNNFKTGFSLGLFEIEKEKKDMIKKVIFNDPATIVFWNDGTKTVVKAGKKEKFSEEKGLAMAIAKKFFGNRGNYYNEFVKWGATK